MTPSIIVTVDKKIGRVSINRPERHNAFDDQLIHQLMDAFLSLSNNHRVHAVVLSGEGKNFSAGADLNWMRRCADYDFEQNTHDAKQLAALLNTIYTCPKPTIACAQGAVYGGGVGLVAVCDIALATADTRFCLSEVKLGLIPAVISPYLVVAMGVRNTKKLALTAEVFAAEEACKFGLVHEVASNDIALEELLDTVCMQLCSGGPYAQSEIKSFLHTLHNQSLNSTVVQRSADLIANIRAGAEGKEGIEAFLQKRAPSWRESPL